MGSPAWSPARPYGSRHWPQSRENLPQLVFDIDVDHTDPAHFWDAPFPADARTLPSGTPDVRGLPNTYGVSFVELAKQSVMYDLDALGPGFSPLPVISFRFDRSVPARPIVPLTTTSKTSGLQLIDLTPGRVGQRVIVDSHVTLKADVSRPASLLQFAPLTGLSLLPGTYAALVLRDVHSDGGVDFDRSPVVDQLLSTMHIDPRWNASFQPLRDQWSTLGVNAIDVAAATVFTVGDPTARVTRFIQQARNADPPTLVSLARGREGVIARTDLVELVGVVRQPQHQAGEPPHFKDTGRFVVDADGNLATTRTEDAPFVLTVPKGKMPKSGWPLLLHIHGTGGKATQAIDRGRRLVPGGAVEAGSGIGSWLAPVGVGTACVAGPYSPDRIDVRALDGYGAYVFMNPPAMRDNFGQMLIEHARFIRLLETMDIDAALIPEVDASASADGRVHFDVKLVGGHSLGSYVSGMLAGTLDDFDGAVLSGAGGTWVEFAFGHKDPIDLLGVVELMSLPPGQHLDRFHPFIDMFETGVAAADNTLFTRHILKHPRAGHGAPHVLVLQGQPDAQVPTGMQRALVRSVGVDFVGDDVGRRSIDRLQPGLHSIGKRALSSPASLNVSVPDHGKRTGVAVRFAEDGLLEGHSVIFQRDDTLAVFVEFVDAVAHDRAPVVTLP